MEGVVTHYSKELRDSTNPGLLLTKYYSELFDLNFDGNKVKLFNRLIKLYGRDLVFKALTEIASNASITHENIYGLLNYICKRYVEKQQEKYFEDLSLKVEEYNIKVNKAKKVKLDLRSPFDE